MTNLIDKKCDDSCNLEFLKPKYRPFVILFLLLHNTLTINLKEDGENNKRSCLALPFARQTR